MQTRLAFSAVLLAMVAAPAWAATQTVRLSVPGMTCPACPITVKKALYRVGGVENVAVAFAQRQAVVTFDDTRTSLQQLTTATANAGYPATVTK